MTKKQFFIILVIVCTLALAGCNSTKAVKPNGKVDYIHATLSIDETDMYSYVGSVDYVFIGTVNKVVKHIKDNELPQTIYSITVDKNLKGNLKTPIEAKKLGGYDKHGTLILYSTDFSVDLGLPEVDKQYMFMAYGQPDGSMILAEINGNVEYTGDQLEGKYEDYIQNQKEMERQRFLSKYDENYKK